jgi:hypothetical protein
MIKGKKNPFLTVDRILLVAGAFITCAMFTILLAFFVGGPFEIVLRILGLEIKELRGVFVDCKRAENANHYFCDDLNTYRSSTPPNESLFKKDPKSLPFNLSN